MPLEELPDGAVVVSHGEAFTIVSGLGFRWTEDSYEAPQPLKSADGLLTPPSTLAAMLAGYAPVLHPSAKGEPRER